MICDTSWRDGTPLGAAPRHVFRRVLDRCHELGYELAPGSRAGVLPPRPRDPAAAVRGLPHLQHSPEHVRAGDRGDHRRNAGVRDRHHHRELRIRGLAVGDQLRPRARAGRAGHGVQLQERRQGARAPRRPDRDLHVEAVRGLGRERCPRAPGAARPRVGRERALGDDADPWGLSDTGRAVRRRPAPPRPRGSTRYSRRRVNCFKRRRTHTFSPTNVSWGLEDRTALVRIKGGSTESRHVENRAPTGLSNPYLVAAATARGRAARDRGRSSSSSRRRSAPAEEDASKPPLPTSVPRSLDGARVRPEARRRPRRRVRNRVYDDAPLRAATIRRPRHRLGTPGVPRALLKGGSPDDDRGTRAARRA